MGRKASQKKEVEEVFDDIVYPCFSIKIAKDLNEIQFLIDGNKVLAADLDKSPIDLTVLDNYISLLDVMKKTPTVELKDKLEQQMFIFS